ncbi:hypothetical protein QTN25_003663 [Entamoeba marina]
MKLYVIEYPVTYDRYYLLHADNLHFNKIIFTIDDRKLYGDVIPQNITCLSEGLFYNSDISFVKLPTSLQSIGKCCFANCTSLSSIEIPSRVTSIEEYCFKNCCYLQSINLPSTITTLSESLFNDCLSLSAITIHSTLTQIADDCFKNCNKLKTVHIPHCSLFIPTVTYSVAILLESNMIHCKNIKLSNEEVKQMTTIPNIVTHISKHCFKNSNITSIEIPSSVTLIEEGAFKHCKSLQTVTFNNNSIFTIPKKMFLGCISLQSINIPSTINQLESYCFAGCSSLSTLHLSNSIEFGEECFFNCNNLLIKEINCNTTTITLFLAQKLTSPNSEKHNISFTYSDRIQLENFMIKSIDDFTMSYDNFHRLCTISIPSTIQECGMDCFNWCISLTSITLPTTLTSLGKSCFLSCSSLQNITLPNLLTTLPYCCFFNCLSLTSIELPPTITSIDKYCFMNCVSLTSINLPTSLQLCGKGCFCKCEQLKNVLNLPDLCWKK